MRATCSAATCIAVLTLAWGASAQDVVLAPAYQPGDTYTLSLRSTTRHDVTSGNEARSAELHILSS